MKPNKIIIIGIQMGERIHHQDHATTLHSLRIMNTIAKKIGNSINETIILSRLFIIYYI
jgi:hypothetical protein